MTVERDEFARDRGLTSERADSLVAGSGAVTIASGGSRYLVSAGQLAELASDILGFLDGFHLRHPERSGASIESLRTRLARTIRPPLFTDLLRRWAGEGWIVVDGGHVRLTEHSELTTDDEYFWSEISPKLTGAARFHPPKLDELAKGIGESQREVREALKRLSRAGYVQEVMAERYYARSTLSEAVGIAHQVESSHGGWITAADFRDVLDGQGVPAGRRVAIGLLEFFDRLGVTIRRGDRRRVNPQKQHLFDPGM
jgi:selenocysteine-specific elongation factor